MVDIVIIGGGPAGLSAALYAKRAGIDSILIDENALCGGQILNTHAVENYLGFSSISGLALGQQFENHVKNLGVQIQNKKLTSIQVEDVDEAVLQAADYKEEQRAILLHFDKKEEIYCKNLILAMGAKHRKLQIPGEDAFAGMGLSYCATCDGAFFKGKKVAVIGGGDVALEDALYLADIGCQVYLIHRRKELRAAAILQKKIQEKENVIFLPERRVTAIEGEDVVQRILLEEVGDTSRTSYLDVEGVFVAVGMEPNTQIVQSVVETDEQGYIVAGEDCASSVPGIYAIGDIRTKVSRQVITAAADGANVIANIQKNR